MADGIESTNAQGEATTKQRHGAIEGEIEWLVDRQQDDKKQAARTQCCPCVVTTEGVCESLRRCLLFLRSLDQRKDAMKRAFFRNQGRAHHSLPIKIECSATHGIAKALSRLAEIRLLGQTHRRMFHPR